ALQHEPGHAHEPVDVGLEDGALVLLRRRGEGIPAETETRGVHEDVDGPGRVDEALAARGIGDVELERDLRLEPLDAARAADDLHARLGEHARGRGADAARRAGDDRGRSLEPAHGPGTLPGAAGGYATESEIDRVLTWPCESATSTLTV